jgi:UrcA family protein
LAWSYIMTFTNLRGSMACAAAALGPAFAGGGHAQPYDGGPYGDAPPPYDQPDQGPPDNGPPGYPPPAYNDDTPYAGGVTVTAPPRHERTASGAEIDRVTASRVVDVSDLDLSTDWGVHELHARVERAAADACEELDNTPGLYPVDSSDADCQHRAVHRAMASVPIGADADYNGY